MNHNLLHELRYTAADLAWHIYEFGDAQVEAVDGWLSEGNEFTRTVYLTPAVVGEPTDKAHFRVVFDRGSNIISDIYVMVDGNIIGGPGPEEAQAPRP